MTLPREFWIVVGALPVGALPMLWPASLAAVLPFFWLDHSLADPGKPTPHVLIGLVPAIIYLLTSIPLFLSTAAGWACSLLLYLSILTTNTLFLAAFWEHGARYQGMGYVKLVVALNVVAALALGLGLLATRKSSSLRGVILCHVGVCCWLFAVAFPWLGETP